MNYFPACVTLCYKDATITSKMCCFLTVLISYCVSCSYFFYATIKAAKNEEFRVSNTYKIARLRT